jgi:hypothetical protein
MVEEQVIKDIFNQSYPSFESLKSNESGFKKLIKWIKGFFEKNGCGSIGFRPKKNGWGGRIRTHECRDQNPVPYRLATPQKSSLCLSKYPNWDLLKNTTKTKFFGLLAMIFLFSSPCLAESQSDNTYLQSVVIRNNRGSAIENMRYFKEGIIYTSQNELFFNLEKLNLSTINNEFFSINNLIVDDKDFYLLTTNGVYKNLKKIFNKEECFHMQKSHERIWISCQSGIYNSKIKNHNKYNWELDEKSPQGVIFFSLNKSQTNPKYAASSQFGFFKNERRKWQKRNIGLRINPNGDFGRFLVTNVFGVETIFLPTSYGIAISNNQAKDFFVDAQGIEKENGLIDVKEITQNQQGDLVLISSTGAYTAKLDLIPKWSQIKISQLRKSENNFINFSAIDITQNKIFLSTFEGEVIQLKDKQSLANQRNYGASFFSSKELIEKFLNLEPKIAEVHEKSLEFAGIPTGKNYQNYSKKARLRNLVPRFETYLERDNENLLNIQTTGQDDLDAGSFSTSFDRVDQNRNNNSLNSGIRLTWDFTRVIYDEEQIDINNNARLTANIRENLLTEITQLYFQRKELITESVNWILNNTEVKSSSEILKQKLKLEESLAQLDARTGAWYSKTLNKELFNIKDNTPQTLKVMELYTNVKVN